jgi:hypothetical protein
MKNTAIREDSGTGTFAAGNFGTDKNSTSSMDKTLHVCNYCEGRHSFITFSFLQRLKCTLWKS